MGSGRRGSLRLQLLKGLLTTGFSAPLLATTACISVAYAQGEPSASPPGSPPAGQSLPASERVDSPSAPGTTPLQSPAGTAGAVEPQVLVSEVAVLGLADHPDKERLERAVYDALTVRPGTSTSRSSLKTDLAAIYATGWFSDVRIQPVDGPLGVRLVVNVTPNPVLKEVVLDNPKALLPKERIKDVFATDYGRTLNLKSLERRLSELQKWYAEQGYSLARITGPTRVSPEGVVELSVREGLVEGIEVQFLNANGDATDEKGRPIKGKSKPWVVSREISLRPGKLFNRRQLEGDIKRLYASGLFSDVKVTLKPIPGKPGEVIILLGVTEQSTGSLSGGIGYSQNQGLFGQIQLQENNLWGNAWNLGVNFTYGQYGALADFNFEIPWLKDDPNRSSFRAKAFISREIPQLFQSQNDGAVRTIYGFYEPPATSINKATAIALNRAFSRPDNLVLNVEDIGFDSVDLAASGYFNGYNYYQAEGDLVRVQRTGANMQYIRPLRGNDPYKRNLWTLIFGLSGQEVVTMNGAGQARKYGAAPFTNNGDPYASTDEILCLAYNCASNNQLVGARIAASYNTLNDNKNPRSGSFLTMSTEQYVSVGENSPTFNRQRLSATHFIPVNFFKFYKGCRPKKGEPEDCSQSIALQLTGGNVTGSLPPYEAFCLGGNNSVRGYYDCDLGVGRSYVEGTIEYRFPIFKIISGELFLDAGSTLGSQNQVPGNPGGLLLKPGQGFSVGTGVIVTTPVGPLRLEVASQDFSGNWRFNVGVGFKF
ncbi:MAG: BamA/TamA family outer membrane protein [Synechococcus lacustris]